MTRREISELLYVLKVTTMPGRRSRELFVKALVELLAISFAAGVIGGAENGIKADDAYRAATLHVLVILEAW